MVGSCTLTTRIRLGASVPPPSRAALGVVALVVSCGGGGRDAGPGVASDVGRDAGSDAGQCPPPLGSLGCPATYPVGIRCGEARAGDATAAFCHGSPAITYGPYGGSCCYGADGALIGEMRHRDHGPCVNTNVIQSGQGCCPWGFDLTACDPDAGERDASDAGDATPLADAADAGDAEPRRDASDAGQCPPPLGSLGCPSTYPSELQCEDRGDATPALCHGLPALQLGMFGGSCCYGTDGGLIGEMRYRDPGPCVATNVIQSGQGCCPWGFDMVPCQRADGGPGDAAAED